jgi:hypothetical protein
MHGKQYKEDSLNTYRSYVAILLFLFILIVPYKVTFGVVASAAVVLRLSGCYVGSKSLQVNPFGISYDFENRLKN